MRRTMIWPEQYFPFSLLALVCTMYSFLYSRPTHSGLPCFCSYVFVRSICCLVGFTCIFVLSMRFSGNLNTQWGTTKGISHKGNVATFPTTEFKPQRSFNLHIHQHYLIQHLRSLVHCMSPQSRIAKKKLTISTGITTLVRECHLLHGHEMNWVV